MTERSLILLNSMGDIEVVWESANDDRMREVIAKKMSEGIRFFIVKPMLGGVMRRRTKLTKMDQLNQSRINVHDDDINKLFSEGVVAVERRDGKSGLDIVSRVTDAAVAAASTTVGMRQFAGG